MNESHLILTTLIQGCRHLKTGIRDGLDTAAEAALRTTLSDIMRELDSIEYEAFTVGHSRGIHFDGLPPLHHFLSNIRNRLFLHFRNKDSCIAELLIRSGVRSSICVLKLRNRLEPASDTRVSILLERYLGCIQAARRSLEEYL